VKRPGWQALLEACAGRSKPDAIIIRNKSRLGREHVELQFRMKQILDAGVRIVEYQTDTPVDFSTATSKFVSGVESYANEMQRESTAKDTREKFAKLARRADRVPGGKLYGYRIPPGAKPNPSTGRYDGQREIHPEERKVVERIFEQRARGYGYQRIANALMDDGVVNPRGGRTWHVSQIASMLGNQTYIGRVLFGRERRIIRGGTKTIEKSTEPVITTERPELRIIADDLWAKAQAVNGASSSKPGTAKRWSRSGKASGALLNKNLLVPHLACGLCGGSVLVKYDPRNSEAKRETLMCQKRHLHGKDHGCASSMRLPYPWVEASVLSALEQTLKVHLWAEMVGAIVDAAQSAQTDLAPLKQEIAGLDTEIANLVKLAAKTGSEALLASLNEKEARKKTLQARLAAPVAKAADLGVAFAQADKTLGEWRTELRKDRDRAGAVLRTVFPERLRILPDGAGWKFEGAADTTAALTPEVRDYVRAVSANGSDSRARRGARTASGRG
jgi:DNA invertase Pin-like site-specific DNA recombinase